MKKLQKFAVVILLVFTSIFLFGCWDNVELDEIFIGTAMAIDATDNPDEFELTIEIAKTGNQTSTTGSKGGGEGKNTIIMKEKAKSMLEVFEMLNFDSSRNIILQHNQVFLVGKGIAEEGITKFMDFFLRERQPRLEVIMVMVDGNAGEILTMDPPQETTSSNYVLGMIKDLEQISPTHKLRILDFVNGLLSKSKTAVMPVIKKKIIEDQEDIQLTGFAFFKNGKLVEIRDEKEIIGYLIADGNIKGQILDMESEDGRIIFYIKGLKCEEKIEVKDGKLKINYQLYPILQVGEVIGFSDYKFIDLIDKAKELGQSKIIEVVLQNIEFLKQINVDALNYAVKIYKKNPNKWKEIEKNWDYLFENAEIKVEVKVTIPNAGKSTETIGMENNKDENR